MPEKFDVALLQQKLYITYHNIDTMKHVIIKTYIDEKDVIEKITRSSFIPFFVNGKLLYKNKYMDGCLPYLFPPTKNRKIFNYKKMFEMTNVNNEISNYGRMMAGLIDIHHFYIKNTSTEICSYVKEWNVTQKCLVKLIVYIYSKFLYFKNYKNIIHFIFIKLIYFITNNNKVNHKCFLKKFA